MSLSNFLRFVSSSLSILQKQTVAAELVRFNEWDWHNVDFRIGLVILQSQVIRFQETSELLSNFYFDFDVIQHFDLQTKSDFCEAFSDHVPI